MGEQQGSLRGRKLEIHPFSSKHNSKMAPISQQTKKNLGNVVVVGGCGFLGHHIVNLLCDSYTCSVSVLDLRTTRNRRNGVEYFDGDITNLDGINKIFSKVKPDVVIHTASPEGNASVPNSVFYKVNVEGTKCIIQACQTAGVKALVYTSSASVISDNVSDLINADERWPVLRAPSQTDYYSETKVLSSTLSSYIMLTKPGYGRRGCPRSKSRCWNIPPYMFNPPCRNYGRGRCSASPSNAQPLLHQQDALASRRQRQLIRLHLRWKRSTRTLSCSGSLTPNLKSVHQTSRPRKSRRRSLFHNK